MFKLLAISAILITLVQSIEAGFAFAMNNQILDTSREFILEHLQNTLNKPIYLPKFSVSFMGDHQFYGNYLHLDHFKSTDVKLYFQGKKLYVELNNLGGKVYGKQWNKSLWMKEHFNYKASGKRGTFSMKYQLTPSLKTVNGTKIPIPVVSGATFKILRPDLVNIDIYNTKDVGPLLLKASVAIFKPVFLKVLVPIANGKLNGIFNSLIKSEVDKSKGQIPMNMIGILMYMIPENRIVIPKEIQMKYNTAHGLPLGIQRGYLYGYYEGAIGGMGNQTITNSTYHTPGDLKIDLQGDPYKFQISTSMINDMFEVLLGTNVVNMDVPYSKFIEYDFPLDFTSTTLDSAVPGLVDVIGYDVSLSARFFTSGAPKFIFTPDKMYVKFDMAVEYWDEGFTKKLFKVYYDQIEIAFKMELKDSFNLDIDWETIAMKSARIEDCEKLFNIRHQEKANQHIMNFFNWSLDFILPWVQVSKPPGLSKFNVPVNIPGLVHFNHITLTPEQNYLNFGMDLVFDTKYKDEWHHRELPKKSFNRTRPNTSKHAVDLVKSDSEKKFLQ